MTFNLCCVIGVKMDFDMDGTRKGFALFNIFTEQKLNYNVGYVVAILNMMSN